MADTGDWQARLAAAEARAAAAEAELAEFQESSRELEQELEAELAKAEARVKELSDQNARLQRDLYTLQEKYQALRESSNTTIRGLEHEVERLKASDDTYRERVRQLEQANDDLERSERAASMSAADVEAKFNQLLERNAFLEEQLETRTETEAELQRTKDELRVRSVDVLQELDVLRLRMNQPRHQAPAAESSEMTVDDDTSPKAPVAAPVTPAGRVRTAAERGSVPLTGSPVVLVQGMLARVMALEQRLASLRVAAATTVPPPSSAPA